MNSRKRGMLSLFNGHARTEWRPKKNRCDPKQSGALGNPYDRPLLEHNLSLSFEGGTVSVPFVDITLSMMKDFSGSEDFSSNLTPSSAKVNCPGYRKDDFIFEVEPDATAASYFLTLPLATGGACFLEGIHRNASRRFRLCPGAASNWASDR